MKLWGGRFTKQTNQLVHNFNASLSFDQKFYEEDITGSGGRIGADDRGALRRQQHRGGVVPIQPRG